MLNIIEQYYQDTSCRIPNLKDLPQFDSQHDGQSDEFELIKSLDEDNCTIVSAQEKILIEDFKVRMHVPVNEKNTNSDNEILDGGIREIGIEAIAFYKSRRYINSKPFIGKWGIFYLQQGVNRVKELIDLTYPGYGPTNRLAYEFLREHERFHFKFDFYALSIESLLRKPLYEPLKNVFKYNSINQVEEALANREVWEWAKQEHIGLKDFSYDFMKLQPGAYARFDEDKLNLSAELAANLIDLKLTSDARREDQQFWIGILPHELLLKSLCPEYFVTPQKLTNWLSLDWKLPEVKKIIEPEYIQKLFESKYSTLKQNWEETKRKLLENPGIPGLDFKKWDKKLDIWSVRINKNFRAHLHRINSLLGTWEVDELGPHKVMGHG